MSKLNSLLENECKAFINWSSMTHDHYGREEYDLGNGKKLIIEFEEEGTFWMHMGVVVGNKITEQILLVDDETRDGMAKKARAALEEYLSNNEFAGLGAVANDLLKGGE